VTSRDPSNLFVYAPTSFGWRTLLLSDTKTGGDPVVADGKINPAAYNRLTGFGEEGKAYREAYLKANPTAWWPPDQMGWNNHVGAFFVAVWLFLAFLAILGFSYSYFWTASTIVYLLLRRNVDAAELDEVYLEEDDQDAAFGGPLTPAAPAAPAKPGATGLTMVDAPSLRPAAPPPGTAPPPTDVSPPPPAAKETTEVVVTPALGPAAAAEPPPAEPPPGGGPGPAAP
jgi:hypothetical protein